VLLIPKKISTIRNWLGFEDYRHRLVDFSGIRIGEMSSAQQVEIPSREIRRLNTLSRPIASNSKGHGSSRLQSVKRGPLT
jgi:hypothetical protein